MGKLVVLELRKSESDHNFEVILEIGEDGERPSTRIPGTLLPLPEISTQYTNWQLAYRNLDLRKRLEIKVRKDPQETIHNCRKSAEIFQEKMKACYDCQEFTRIRETLLNKLNELDEIRLIIQTNDSQLRRLPWHLFFERFLENYRKAEIALSPPEYERPEKVSQAAIRKKVRILAVLGNSTGINIETDRQLLKELPDAETVFLAEPKLREIHDQLWDEKGWDILFFAGHSSSQKNGETGRIYINQSDSLPLNQLKYALVTAIEKGLTLAIFNSCDGLGLARELAELHIPQIIVMREPVPDGVAQAFLKYFLSSFSSGKSLYLAAREARERLHGLEDQFPCATWLPVICQHPAELPITWQQLQGIQPELKSVDNSQDKNSSKTLAEFVPSGFDLLDERFFQTQGQGGESRLLKLREATWSLIIKGNYIDRDQQEELLDIAEELAEDEGISILLIRGEPGAGKTALMRWLVYQLFLQGHLILQKKTQQKDLNWLEVLQEFSVQINEQHFYVISDDIFRDKLILDELEEDPTKFPFTLIGTTRLNEDEHQLLDGLGYMIKFLNVNPPSQTEKERILAKVCENSEVQARLDSMTEAEKKQLMAAPAMLALMLQLSEGKIFGQKIADIIKELPNTEKQPVYDVFGVICSFFHYGISVPPEIIPLCLAQYPLGIIQDVVDVANTGHLEGLVNKVTTGGYEGLATIHELIAQTAIEQDYRPRDNENPPYSNRLLERNLKTVIQAIDVTQEVNRSWIIHALNRLSMTHQADLVRQLLSSYPNQIQNLQQESSIPEWLIWAKIYGQLRLSNEQKRCINVILSSEPKNTSDWIDWLSVIQKFGSYQQKQEAITKIANWLEFYPEDSNLRRKYLIIVGQQGTLEQKQAAITKSTVWIQRYPNDSSFHNQYLDTIRQWGTLEQLQETINQTLNWLQVHPDDERVRNNYLDLVCKRGTLEQKQEAINQTLSWRQDYPDNAHIYTSYLKLIKRLGQLEETQEAIEQTINWLKEHQDNRSARLEYLELVENFGTKQQKEEAIEETALWLQLHPDSKFNRIQYLKLVQKLGTSEQQQQAIDQTAAWLQVYDDWMVHNQYLELLQKQGSSEQKEQAIEICIERFKESLDNFQSIPRYIKLICDFGTPEQKQQAIYQVSNLLQLHPDIESFRVYYLELVKQEGNSEQQQQAINETANWLKDHQNSLRVRNQHLKLIAQFGTPQEQEEAIQQTASWLENNDDWSVRTQYILLLNKQGTPQQQQEAIKETNLWLEKHPDDIFVRTQYIDLIRKQGTPKQQQEVIEKIAIWLEEHPNDWRVRARYLTLIETLENIQQKQAAIQQTTLWLKDNPKGLDNQYLRNAYLGLIKYQGTVEQQQEAIAQTLSWLQNNPDNWDDPYIRTPYLYLLKKHGTKQQQQDTITQIALWLDTHPNDSENIKFFKQYRDLINNWLIQKLGRTDEVEEIFRLSQTIPDDLKDPQSLAIALQNLGLMLIQQKKWNEAEKILRHSYDISVQLKGRQGQKLQAIILNKLGKVIHQQRQKEKFNLALMYFRKSIEIGIQIDDQEHLAKVYTDIGKALLTNRETEEAIKYLIQAFEIDESLKNIRGLEIVTKKLTQVLKKEGRLAEAINYYERAMVVSPNNQDLLEPTFRTLNCHRSKKPLK